MRTNLSVVFVCPLNVTVVFVCQVKQSMALVLLTPSKADWETVMHDAVVTTVLRLSRESVTRCP